MRLFPGARVDTVIRRWQWRQGQNFSRKSIVSRGRLLILDGLFRLNPTTIGRGREGVGASSVGATVIAITVEWCPQLISCHFNSLLDTLFVFLFVEFRYSLTELSSYDDKKKMQPVLFSFNTLIVSFCVKI